MRGRVWTGLAAWLVATSAWTGLTTTVALRTQDATLPKLGLPSVKVQFQGTGPVALDTLRTWMTADVLRLSHVRDGAEESSPDYTLVVRFVDGAPDSTEVDFEAALLTHEGAVAWLAEGRTTRDGALADGDGWRTIGRNVISALFRDGWLQPKSDPNDPPPPPPIVGPGR